MLSFMYLFKLQPFIVIYKVSCCLFKDVSSREESVNMCVCTGVVSRGK